MQRRNRVRVIPFVFFLWLVGFAGSPALGVTIEIGNQIEPPSLDPQIITGIQEEHIINQLFEGLYMLDPKTLAPIPGVAESYTVSPDGKRYTFKLRQNAKWSNGDPVTAEDFVYSWKRLADPNTRSESIHNAWLIKNAKTNRAEMGVNAKGPHVLEVELENPVPYFMKLLEHYSMMPVHRASIEKHGDKWINAGNLVSNGPYALEKWEAKKIIVLKKNPYYWDKDKMAIDQANLYPVEDQDAEEAMFRTKKLHVTAGIPVEKVEFWKADKTGVYHNHPYFSVYFYRLNTRKAPLNDARVRQALSLAIDRDQITRLVLKGGQLPATCYTPPKSGDNYDCRNNFPAKADIKRAKQLLSQAGFRDGKNFPKGIELTYNNGDIHKKIAEAIQQMWRKNLGIEVALLNQEWKVLLDNVNQGNYQIARGSWTGDFLDPVTFLNLWVSDNGKNNTGYNDPAYDQLLAKAAAETQPKKRVAILREAEKKVSEAVPAIPIYVYARQYLLSPQVKGWDPNILGKWYLKYVSLEKKKDG